MSITAGTEITLSDESLAAIVAGIIFASEVHTQMQLGNEFSENSIIEASSMNAAQIVATAGAYVEEWSMMQVVADSHNRTNVSK